LSRPSRRLEGDPPTLPTEADLLSDSEFGARPRLIAEVGLDICQPGKIPFWRSIAAIARIFEM
jgi:hypothetical protein